MIDIYLFIHFLVSMKNIEYYLSKTNSLHTASIVQIFKSKKHTVCLLQNKTKKTVLKLYKKGFQNNFIQEQKILSHPEKSFLKPKLVDINEKHQFLVLEYIPGKNVCD